MYISARLTIYILQKRKGAIKIGITINEILIPRKLFSAKLDKELEFDTPLPDYCPDIARIVKVDCTPFAESCSAEDGKATVRGRAVYDVLYETDYKNRLRCCTFTQEFSHSVPLPRSNASGITSFCSVRCERLDCKLLSPRRIVIRSSLGAQFDIEGEDAVKAVAASDDENIFFRKKTIGFDGKTEIHKDSSRFSEQLVLNRNEKCIGEIVCGSVFIQPAQATFLPGRADIKSTASVHVLCEEENNEGHYYMAIKTIPISIEYSNPAIDDGKHITFSLEASDTEFSPELDQYGESRIIKTDFSVKTTLKINESKAFTVADDLFEKDHDSILIKSDVALPHLYSETDVSFSAEGKSPPFSPQPEALLDSSAKGYGASAEKTEGGIKIAGSFIVTLTVNTGEGIFSFDQSVPYEQVFPIELPEGDAEIVADTYPIEVMTTLHSDGSITARVIAGAKIYTYSETSETFVTEIPKRTPIKSTADGCTMVYCYPGKNESLWSIAKLYRADPETIRDLNSGRFDESGKANGRDPILIKC